MNEFNVVVVVVPNVWFAGLDESESVVYDRELEHRVLEHVINKGLLGVERAVVGEDVDIVDKFHEPFFVWYDQKHSCIVRIPGSISVAWFQRMFSDCAYGFVL